MPIRSTSEAYEPLGISRSILALCAVASYAWYLVWRLGTLNPAAPVFSVLLYAAEAYGLMTLLLHMLMTWRLTVREAPMPRAGHSVDIFIPTINEPVEVVRRTAIKAMDVRYPHETYILDDGNREEIRALAAALGCHYLSRPSHENAKAGNLNHALRHSRGEFIALFDADHAPKESFLERTLGYFTEPRVAFVQTPQDFYNLDSFQHHTRRHRHRVWTEQSLFFRVIQRGKDYWNAAFFCGSCAVVRRSHLESIGGFVTGTVTEDIHTSIRLHKAGFTSVYHAEPLAFGIAPAQAEHFLKQRVRWGQGAMQVWRQEGILFSRRLTWPQKLCYMASMITYFDGWQKCLFYVTPAIVLIAGLVPINCDPLQFLIHFAPYFALSLWCGEELGRGYGKTLIIEQYNMARFAAFCYATVGLFTNNLKFRVTSKEMTSRTSFHWCLFPQYAVLIGNAVAIPAGLVLFTAFGTLPASSLYANLVWASVNLMLAAMVLIFSLRRRGYRRRNYRFCIPVRVRLRTKHGEELFGMSDNISCTGAQIRLPSPVTVREGEAVEGEFFLPSGSALLHAVVRGAEAEELRCEFLWNDIPSRSLMERYLYGSDLEWRVHRLTEKSVTLLDFLSRGGRPAVSQIGHIPSLPPVRVANTKVAQPERTAA